MMNVSNEFVFKSVIMSAMILFLLPTCISVFVGETVDASSDDGSFAYDLSDSLLSGYNDFTGMEKHVNEEIWVLRGIYTPFGVGADGLPNSSYLFTQDNWLAGDMVRNYTPVQYSDGTGNNFTVQYDDDKKCYTYTGTTQDGHSAGDVYTSVTMDYNQRSDIFFTTSGRHSEGQSFYYDFSGWRYSFVPQNSFYVSDQDGNIQNVIATSTSLSLIWYDIYGGMANGLSGNLVISGNDSGVAYLNSTDILREIGQNNIARFDMTFNGGVNMNVYIKINPYYTSRGWSIEQCWNAGYWSVMVTSISTSIDTYTSTQYSFNIQNIWETFIDLFTFNTENYNMSPTASTICSVTISLCLYATLLSIGITCWPVLLLAGLVAAIQAFSIADIAQSFQWPWE